MIYLFKVVLGHSGSVTSHTDYSVFGTGLLSLKWFFLSAQTITWGKTMLQTGTSFRELHSLLLPTSQNKTTA